MFSYADIKLYKKVKLNLEKHGIPYYEWESVQMEELAMNLSKMNS